MTRRNPSLDLSVVAAFAASDDCTTTIREMREQVKKLQPEDALSVRGQKMCPHHHRQGAEWDHWLATTVSHWHVKGYIRKPTPAKKGAWELTHKGVKFCERFCAQTPAPKPRRKLFPVYVTQEQAALIAGLFLDVATAPTMSV